jgi:hypothetical protein
LAVADAVAVSGVPDGDVIGVARHLVDG